MTTVDYTAIYDPDTDFDAHFTRATGRRIAARVLPGHSVLELGCATGLMTTLLAGEGCRVLGVDRSLPYLERARARELPGCAFAEGDLDDLGDLGRFDHVVLANVLHEVGDPAAVLRAARGMLHDGGLVHVSLQNPRSLHRLVAAEMGLIERLDTVAERGVRFGTRRLFAAEDVVELAREAGLEPVAHEGVFLKPLPNDAMAALPADVLEGFERAARHLPEHGAMNLFAFRSDGR